MAIHIISTDDSDLSLKVHSTQLCISYLGLFITKLGLLDMIPVL